MLQPTIEVYVLWHPADDPDARLMHCLLDHFHGSSYCGLLGQAIEVFARCQPWAAPGGPPRPIPLPGARRATPVEPADLTAVVVLAGTELERAVENDAEGWRAYVRGLCEAQAASPDRVRLFPVRAEQYLGDAESALSRHLGASQGIVNVSPRQVCRDLAQGLAQWAAGGGAAGPLKVFISHTKHDQGAGGRVAQLIAQVRDRIDGSSRLASFFDTNALQAGEDWAQTLRAEAAGHALLALRTDLYASREWCQREMLIAKQSGVPVVVLDAPDEGEPRGSFLMDHVPRVPVRRDGNGWSADDIDIGLARLVDQCLQRALWQRQRDTGAEALGFVADWWASQAPEPATLVAWMRQHPTLLTRPALRILHPDPPLGPEENVLLAQIAELAGLQGQLDIATPRLLAARGA